MATPINPTGVSTAFVYPTQTAQGSGAETIIGTTPPNTNPPIIFEPPPGLAGNALNVEIIASGPENWGGCQVFISMDNETYGNIGTIFLNDVQGVLTAPFPMGSDPDTTDTLSVDVTMSQGQVNPTTQIYADKFLSLALVDAEVIAYTNAVLTGDFAYNFDTYIRRGVYGTVVANHSTGAQFGLILADTFRQVFPYNLIGTTLYFKFPSFNMLGLQTQDLSDLPYYQYTLQGSGVVPSPWFMSWSVGGKFTDFIIDPSDGNYEIFDMQAPMPLVFAQDFMGSPTPGCEVPPSSNVTLTIQLINASGTSVVGTLTYTSGSTVGAYNVPATFSTGTGDRIRLIAPPGVDGTIAGAYGTIVGSQTN